jgi:hypothetical protein
MRYVGNLGRGRTGVVRKATWRRGQHLLELIGDNMMKSFWLGLGTGLGLAALLAPDRGEVTRSKLARQLSNWAGWNRDDPKDEMHEDTLDKL